MAILGPSKDGGESRDERLVLPHPRRQTEDSRNRGLLLSAERYRQAEAVPTLWPTVPLDGMVKLVRGVTYKKSDEVEDNGYQVLRANNIDLKASSLDLSEIKNVSPSVRFSDEKKLRSGDVFICLASGSKDHIGKVTLISNDSDYYFGGFMEPIRVDQSKLQPEFLYWILRDQRFNDFLRRRIIGANINNLSAKILNSYQVPLPPLEVQRTIVAEIEGYQKVIDGAPGGGGELSAAYCD